MKLQVLSQNLFHIFSVETKTDERCTSLLAFGARLSGRLSVSHFPLPAHRSNIEIDFSFVFVVEEFVKS